VTDEPPEPADPTSAAWLSEVLSAHAGPVRVYWVVATTMQGLVDRLAVVLGEHMTTGDDLNVTYNAMQSGWQQHPAQPRSWTHPPQTPCHETRGRRVLVGRAADTASGSAAVIDPRDSRPSMMRHETGA